MLFRSLGGADLLRRAMGKKKLEEMMTHRAVFAEGAAKKGIDELKANEIFDLMEKFAGYGFNKSHAAAYALLAYHTAWLKVHYLSEFTAANMSVALDDTDKQNIFHHDAVMMSISFEPPNVNLGAYRFVPISKTVVRYGLGAIKGTGQSAIEAIVAAREAGGAFTSLFDFCARVDRQRINRRTIEALIKAGAFDLFKLERATLMASVSLAMEYAESQAAHANQGGLFDFDDVGSDQHGSSSQEPEWPVVEPWTIRERLLFEKAALGFYVSGHMFDQNAAEVRLFAKRANADVLDSREPQLLAGIVGDLRVINGQRGKVAIFKLDDKSEPIEAVASEELLNANKDLLKDDELIIVQGKVQPDRFSGGLRLTVQALWDLPTARCRFGKYLRVEVNGSAPPVAEVLRDHPVKRVSTELGDVSQGLGVRLLLKRDEAIGELDLGEAAKFFPSDAALETWRLNAHGGKASIVYE